MTTMTKFLSVDNHYINDAAHDLDLMINEANGNYELANAYLEQAWCAKQVQLAIDYASKAQGIQYHLHCILIGSAYLPFGCRLSWVKDAYYSIKGNFNFEEAYKLLNWYKNN